MQQMSFDMEFTDAKTQEIVPWASYDDVLLKRIKKAPWKFCDLETTGLNPASEEINFSSKDIQRGINPRLRLRVCSVLFPSNLRVLDKPYEVVAFDFDTLTPFQKKKVAEAVYSEVFINHNVGFDAYWLAIETSTQPLLVLDTMLMARILYPEQPLKLAEMCNDENIDADLRRAAEMSFMQGRSGWSLADLVLTLKHRLVAKDLQKAKNWCEPFLSQDSYNYASGDTIETFEVFCALFNLDENELFDNPHALLDAYYKKREQHKGLRIIEPQVLDVVMMRLHGMPWDQSIADEYVRTQKIKVKELAATMVKLAPALKPFEHDMQLLDKGITKTLKQTIGEVFTEKGLILETTEKTGDFKIGEKDLRKVKAAILNPETQALFVAWSSLNKAKKAANMAIEVSKFAQRSPTKRLHPNTGHGPVTGRLSSSEPNCQQFPRDQGFRNSVHAAPGHKIIASDYSALDMRVGAALAIRAQEQIIQVYKGLRKASPDVQRSIQRILSGSVSYEKALENEQKLDKAFQDLKTRRDEETSNVDGRKRYWDTYRQLARTLLLAGFERCLAYVQRKAQAAGTETWGSLRDAFSIPGMDIHTWTALSMIGKDPIAIFSGLSEEDIAIALKKEKKALGDVRQTGKVGNLSLLYAMKTLGLMDAAAKNYNIHWTFEEADKVRRDWLASYVEIDLWHKWLELNPAKSVFVPDPDRGNKPTKKEVYPSVTLGGRLIYAFGLNAALSYEDQSTGADILGRVMETLRVHHNDVFNCVINQVHDELVFEVPDEKVEEYTKTISAVMVDCAEHFLSPYGVKGECSPAVGDVWLKD